MDSSISGGGPGLSSGLMIGGLNAGISSLEDQKFNIIQADCQISTKVSTKPQRPCQSYIDIEFRKENETPYFSYLIF